MFEVVEVLPDINDAQSGKIYCIKDTSSSEDDNKYIEWVKIKTADNTYKFEKVGEFNTEPDLSGYAKLSGANFTGNINTTNLSATNDIRCRYFYPTYIAKNENFYLRAHNEENKNKVFATNGSLAEIGTEENLIFTLEDGSTVTKKIRVLSSTTTPAT